MKRIILGVLLIFSMVVGGCQGKEVPNPAKDIPVEQPVVEQNKVEPEVPKASKGGLELIGQGKLPGIAFGIGASCQEIINKMGQPEQQDYFEGGLYLDYGKIVFLTDGDESYQGKVTSISITEGQLFGVKVGMKPAEIIKVLGKPSQAGGESEGYQIRYDVKGYSLSFVADKEDAPTLSASIAGTD